VQTKEAERGQGESLEAFQAATLKREVTWQNLAKIGPPFFLPALAMAPPEHIESQRDVSSVTLMKGKDFKRMARNID
jgi:hypothetical protein